MVQLSTQRHFLDARGTDEMLNLLVLTGLCLLGTGLFMASQRKRYRIRHTGTLVMAKVTRGQMWQDAPRADFSLQTRMIPFLGGGWWYEICAQWTDPHTGNTYMITSGAKKGLPGYQRGDYIPAYVSPYVEYLKLS